MKTLKKKVIVTALLFLCFSLLGANRVNPAKADAKINNAKNTTTVVRAASVKTDKVIIVPKKADTSKNTVKNSKKSLSRGSSGRSDVVSYSYKFLGKPYVWGASGPSSFDCSGFTAYVYNAFGVSLAHYTGSQFQVGQAVSKENLLPGDLVFFNTYGDISHVGIYIGGGQFIHASSGSGKVTISQLSGSYYTSRYAGARRILN